jgi:hypothetical protein
MTLTEPKHLKLWKHPDNYLGATWYDYYVVLGQHRDSDVITRSNFRVAKAELEAIEDKFPEWNKAEDEDKFPEWNKAEDEDKFPEWNKAEDEGRMLVNPCESHWAVGHVEWLGVHKDAPAELIAAADNILARIESYPALSDDDWSELEYTEAMEYWDSMSLSLKVNFCRDCGVSIFAARRSSDLADRLYEALTSN